MSKVQFVINLHDKGRINLLDKNTFLQQVAKKYGISATTVCDARKIIRKREGWKPPIGVKEKVIQAHKANKIDLRYDSGKYICDVLGVNGHAIADARKALGINKTSVRISKPMERWWWSWNKKYGIFRQWGVIPERVGKSKRQWQEYVRNMQ